IWLPSASVDEVGRLPPIAFTSEKTRRSVIWLELGAVVQERTRSVYWRQSTAGSANEFRQILRRERSAPAEGNIDLAVRWLSGCNIGGCGTSDALGSCPRSVRCAGTILLSDFFRIQVCRTCQSGSACQHLRG